MEEKYLKYKKKYFDLLQSGGGFRLNPETGEYEQTYEPIKRGTPRPRPDGLTGHSQMKKGRAVTAKIDMARKMKEERDAKQARHQEDLKRVERQLKAVQQLRQLRENKLKKAQAVAKEHAEQMAKEKAAATTSSIAVAKGLALALAEVKAIKKEEETIDQQHMIARANLSAHNDMINTVFPDPDSDGR